MIALLFSPAPRSRFEAMTEAKRRIASTKRPIPISWLSAGIAEWVLDLDDLRASEESVKNLDWLRGDFVCQPELEFRLFELAGSRGRFDAALTVYITPQTVGERAETPRCPVSSCEDRWEIVRPLPSGGQGKVWVVRDKKRCESRDQIRRRILGSVADLSKAGEADRLKGADALISAIEWMRDGDATETQGVLKVLHSAEAGRESDPERARERMRREIKAMSDTSHSGLLRILDSDVAGLWYVSEYHCRGTLSDRQDAFSGNVAAALRTIRNVVEGVAVLHGKGFAHRDIKPENIFLSADNRLVLGDFGLVFREEEGNERISKTLDNALDSVVESLARQVRC
ncbi:MAG: protein kinase [Planctomycetota bacterium]|nr:protein kinase [Planctomycetota bacterium]